MTVYDLGQLGWTADLAAQLAALEAQAARPPAPGEEIGAPSAPRPGLTPGRITAAHRAAFDVRTVAGSVRTRLAGRLVHEGVDAAVGDWVGLGDGLIRSVLPRRSAIVRKEAGFESRPQTLAANVDVAFVVSSLGPSGPPPGGPGSSAERRRLGRRRFQHMDLEPRRIERYLVTIWESGAAPEIVLTKADRLGDPSALVSEVQRAAIGVPVHVVSALTGQGCDALRARIAPGTTAVLLGSSGVGKSTLVNRFAGRGLMAVRETRADDDEGRHTTTHRELIVLPGGGVVIDTPGLRELQLWSGGSVEETFADVEELAASCRFNDCSHAGEPGCAVQAALRSGELPEARYDSWRKLQRELRAVAVRADARLRREEKRKWQQRAREGRARARRL